MKVLLQMLSEASCFEIQNSNKNGRAASTWRLHTGANGAAVLTHNIIDRQVKMSSLSLLVRCWLLIFLPLQFSVRNVTETDVNPLIIYFIDICNKANFPAF